VAEYNGNGPRSAWIVYPHVKHWCGTFPVITFLHSRKSPVPSRDYAAAINLTASLGFIVVAPESCTEGCKHFTHDALASIYHLKDHLELHPVLARANWSSVGLWGHALGGGAALHAASLAMHQGLQGVRAVAAQHPAAGQTVAVPVPTLLTAGTADELSEPKISQLYYSSRVQAGVPKIFLNFAGAGHEEPLGRPGQPGAAGREALPVALFFACWLRGEACDRVYGSSSRAICGEDPKLAECSVSGDLSGEGRGHSWRPARTVSLSHRLRVDARWLKGVMTEDALSEKLLTRKPR